MGEIEKSQWKVVRKIPPAHHSLLYEGESLHPLSLYKLRARSWRQPRSLVPPPTLTSELAGTGNESKLEITRDLHDQSHEGYEI